jgi:DNA-binding response OmpR family regulator
MKKIIIAINNDFIRDAYREVFSSEGFDVFEAKEDLAVLNLAAEEKPELIILDAAIQKGGGAELLRELKKNEKSSSIPVIIFAQFERKEDRIKAMELGAKDYITATDVTPKEALLKVKIAVGEQKSYRVEVKDISQAGELLKDLGKQEDFKCPKCQSQLILYMIRDLSKGQNYFKVSFMCPKCLQ